MSTDNGKTTSRAKKSASKSQKRPASIKMQAKKAIKPIILFALIKMSGVGITEASGKLGGNVFTRNKGGAVLRNRVVGTNPQTVAQQAVRAVFGAISSAWRSLTDAERDAWNEITADYPYQNRLGETKLYSGKALFQKLNNNLLYAGESIATTPTSPEGVNAPVHISSLSIQNLAGDADEYMVDGNLATAGDSTTIVVVEATPPLSPGVKNANSRFVRVAQAVAASSAFSINFTAAYVDIFGVAALGTQVQARTFSINPATGEKSAYLKATQIVIGS